MNSLFSQRLKTLREERGLTMQKLGEEIGTSGVSIGYYERGERVPDIHILAKMCQFFGVTSDYLIGLEDCRTHEAADISARTGLTEAAVDALETMWRVEKGRKSPSPFDEITDDYAWTRASILSEIVEANIQQLSYDEFLFWWFSHNSSVYSDDGEYLGDVLCEEDQEGTSIYFVKAFTNWSKHKCDNLLEADILPKSYIANMKVAYNSYCQLISKCRVGPPMLDMIQDLYHNKCWKDTQLHLNTKYGVGCISGGNTANWYNGDERLEEVCKTSSADVVSFSALEILDELIFRKICDGFRHFRKRRIEVAEDESAKRKALLELLEKEECEEDAGEE